MARGGDALALSLERAAEAADRSAAEQRDAAAAARGAARARREPGAEGSGSDHGIRLVLELLGRSLERMALALGDVRRTWAATLADEGLSIRQIGTRLGVSHQRVSALLHRRDRRTGGG